jgi:uncharacterized membrane protein
MNPVHAVVSFSLLLSAVMLHLAPVLSRPDILFSVTVPQGFRADPRARAVLGRYRLILWLTVVSAVGVVLSTDPGPILAVCAGAPTLVAVSAWAWARTRIRPFRVEPPTRRSAALTPRDDRIPGGWLAFAGPLIILAVSGLLLAAYFDRIPDRFPTHWAIDGTPDRWADRTPAAVFSPVLLGCSVVGMTLFFAWSIVRRTRQVAPGGPAAVAEGRFKRVSAVYMLASAYLSAVLFSVFSVYKLFASDQTIGAEVWIPMGMVVSMSVAMTVWLIRAGQAGQRRIEPGHPTRATGDRTPDSAWKGGVFYFNRDDPAWLVEKRMGLGWTFNFARATSWLVLAAMLATPFVIVLLS